jgi:hypothetical protein
LLFFYPYRLIDQAELSEGFRDAKTNVAAEISYAFRCDPLPESITDPL